MYSIYLVSTRPNHLVLVMYLHAEFATFYIFIPEFVLSGDTAASLPLQRPGDITFLEWYSLSCIYHRRSDNTSNKIRSTYIFFFELKVIVSRDLERRLERKLTPGELVSLCVSCKVTNSKLLSTLTIDLFVPDTEVCHIRIILNWIANDCSLRWWYLMDRQMSLLTLIGNSNHWRNLNVEYLQLQRCNVSFKI